jgi:hypothetical protein
MKTHIDLSGSHWPQNFTPYIYTCGLTELICFLDFEPADRSLGMPANAWLVHAYAGGIDIMELLKDHIIEDIEIEAAAAIEQDIREGAACSLSLD